MSDSNLVTLITSFGSLLSAGVTAVATIFLWRVTNTLAKETKRLAEAGAQPHVVASIEPNQWIMFHAELRLQNTGNATAYDVEVTFDPPLPARKNDRPLPLQTLSVLKPGQGISSHIMEFEPLFDTTFTVTTSWRKSHRDADRESNSYTINLDSLKGLSQLGAATPIKQLADDVKHMREDWKNVASGFKRLKVDIHTSADRLHERRQLERRWRQERNREAAQVSPEAQTPNE